MTQEEYKIYIDNVIRRVEFARVRFDEKHIVKIVAISKYSTAEEIEKLYRIGQRAFGENKVQDLRAKSLELEELPLEWHFVGNLQKNKINNLLDINPALFHALDSLELAHELQKKLEARDMKLEALLQINSAKEESKHGVMPEVALEVYNKIKKECPNIHLRGVMSIGAHTDDKAVIKKSFETTYSIYKQLEGATICSMGMSGDFDLAIECGSNMVRLGSIMFNK
ncbi:MAG: YggS family pyridoxal phosphate enzyme [Sulfurimonas sp. RIFCSPLOWO2_12_36_12]|uniref:YggS family pyridoxal phosphate-dependent enzyme n=1 Tax=Sulfurimonas sp. RIFCSPLOWO2_12_36_12 TaxID=1802253 RepID=UPI0008D374A3|nr:YggS family pyridoxal phosphate-dependent enzyme [Sulfurimonas sp. RIFCSPLOWO2_12_36_12]OHD99570.1 MAG: YggS family pyridoxal phosphate enzyme [Sulfurimonas sp. RIFCSPLOWO2_02_FULL_36_28]OHE02405.1 MAG: YggS family pyridoxal phosphate enzyme [Sulfurimonas sp. RIFCSPLOWO2_12_36_12]